MDILAAIKREERKLEKQLGKLQQQLNGVRAAAKALGHSTEHEFVGVKGRVLSAAGRAKMAAAAGSAGLKSEHKREKMCYRNPGSLGCALRPSRAQSQKHLMIASEIEDRRCNPYR